MQEVGEIIHHLDFLPRLDLARELIASPATRPSSMLDLSDGLARDALRLSHRPDEPAVNLQIELERLPLSRACLQATAQSGLPPWQHAIGDGEDYELLFTAGPGIPQQVAGVRISEIGSVEPATTSQHEVIFVLPDGSTRTRQELTDLGWEHRA